MTALMVAQINVKDADKLQQYIAANRDIAAPYGAKMLFRGKVARTLNGEADHQMLVVVEFPDADAVSAWFDSDAYQPLIDLREAAADMRMIAYQA